MSGKWTYADLPSLEGKIAIVTGSTGGIGLETAAKLASKGATVIVPGRNPEKVKAAVEEIRQKANGKGTVVPEAMDQMDLASVDAFAKRVLANYEKLDILGEFRLQFGYLLCIWNSEGLLGRR